ncbi:T9SS type A sorting domain-containing protein [Weeksellaceae bacterium KMM 9713]|uniref:T9SS type A sorting domain-containing protein n=1 Tax=Profundicola chukchiensis TaxID=2961959 RepID=A0A9X4RX93_9FLAO|nr:GEVED domain-containing protein [Profundicola chukchiensis]MDG4946632.1 T9SS type A sorting domain-containing protein [Profundicola chukchiensis]
MMKRFTLLLCLSYCTLGLSQVQAQHQSREFTDATSYQNMSVAETISNQHVLSRTNQQGANPLNPNQPQVNLPATGFVDSEMTSRTMLYFNGPYWNVNGTPKKSVLESVALGMNSIGSEAKAANNTTVADDFVLNNDADITAIDLFAYQTGSITPSITSVFIQIWDGNPSQGASVIWGDLTTNVISGVSYSGANRVVETDMEATNREIQKVTAATPGLSLTAGTYWIEYTFAGVGASGPYVPPVVILGETTTGNAIQRNVVDNEIYFVQTLDSGTGTPQGMPFILHGEITAGDTFPAPYCETDFLAVEPITLVEVSNISNRSSAEVEDNVIHEDFTAIVGNMVEGETYPITLEGNTNGDNANTFTVFIDWNQDGEFNNAEERYEIGTIYNSNGNDNNQVSGNIVVPAGVVHGQTRMRVMKTLGTDFSIDACTGFAWGQAEDYTIDVTATTVNAPFPYPYCGPIDYTLVVEPITLVDVAGIYNVSDSGLNSSPAHEDFTSIVGEMTAGQTYSAILEGNTDGYTNSFTIFIDWNQDGELNNEDERYEIGVLDGSTGADGIQAVGEIQVPEDALAGPTRMRVIKRYTSTGGDYANDSCSPGSNYGQAEDYTINVTAASMSTVEVKANDFNFYPNPTTNDIFLKSSKNIESVVVYNMLGQTVKSMKVDATDAQISLGGLKAGNYVMQVSIDGKTTSHKVMKK